MIDTPYIQEQLLLWYNKCRRDLPWRKETDPYRIWVSEIMLQQTRVDTVVPYYERFIQRFPTLTVLAVASEEEVIKYWEGLGYYSRVRNLHAAVKKVKEQHGGKVPDCPAKLAALPGVGAYTMGAILSIGFNQPVPAVDGNVLRVFSRLFCITEEISLSSTKSKINQLALELIPPDAPGDFNQALMELGATICTPTSPDCLRCPLQAVCKAYQKGIQKSLPLKKRKKPPVMVNMVFAGVVSGDRILLCRRPKDGLLGGMWALPTTERGNESSLDALLRLGEEQHLIFYGGEELEEVEHVFSHRRWKAVIVQANLKETESLPMHWEWVTFKDLHLKAFPVVYQKALRKMGLLHEHHHTRN